MISIIVPVYNIKSYISQCIESILSQTYLDFQLILVVDKNSIDASETICRKYAEIDNRVQVLNSPHFGLGGARNFGLSVSTGEYVLFVDADDFLPHDTLETYMNLMHGNVEIVFGRYASYYSNPENYVYENSKFDENTIGLSGEQAYVKQLKINKVPLWTAWRYACKRELYDRLGFAFKDGICAEDLQFVPHLILSAKEIAFTNKIVYYYRRNREDSLVSTLSEKRYTDSVCVINEWLTELNTNSYSADFNKYFTQQLARTFSGMLSSAYFFPKSKRTAIFESFRGVEYLLNNPTLIPAVRYSYRILGLKMTSFILNLRIRLKRIFKKIVLTKQR